MPVKFTPNDLRDVSGLERVLRQFETALNTLKPIEQQPTEALNLLTERLLPIIRTQLQSRGSTPLNLQSLPGGQQAPTISNFTNAQHNHQNATGGGVLDAAAIATGILPVVRGGTGSGTAAGARTSLGVPAIGISHTVTLAALTGGGTQGSLTFVDGVLTVAVDPT